MGDRANVHAEILLDAGRRYGDAKLALERNMGLRADTPEWQALVKAVREAEGGLHSAARAYATRMRRKAPKAAPLPSGDGAGPETSEGER